jgi:hypothetical protein
MRRSLTALAACLALGACGGGSDPAPSTTASAPPAGTQALSGSGGANTAEVVAAADAFLATLTADQRDLVVHDAGDPARRRGWSDLPASALRRDGIGFGDLSDEQEQAALALMESALSDQGYTRLQAIRKADAHLDATRDSEGASYGQDLYFIALFGRPSAAEPFSIGFGGHHLAYNLSYRGQDVSLAPSLTAVEPREFAFQGVEYAPLEDQAAAASEAVAALTGRQRADAELARRVGDLVLGPGDDGPFPEEPEGVVVGSLTAKQQERVTAMLRAWVGDVAEEAAGRLIDRYVAEYGETRLAWSGSATAGSPRTYIRLDGPSIWIEFSNRPGEETAGAHPHTIVRDEAADYGGG